MRSERQLKPRKGTDDVKGIDFDGSQGMPSRPEIRSMSSSQYVKKGVDLRAVGKGGVVRDEAGCVFIELGIEAVRHAFTLVPKSATRLVAPPILQNDAVPALTLDIIGRAVLNRYVEENVVIDPFRDGANPLRAKDVEGGITKLAVDPSR